MPITAAGLFCGHVSRPSPAWRTSVSILSAARRPARVRPIPVTSTRAWVRPPSLDLCLPGGRGSGRRLCGHPVAALLPFTPHSGKETPTTRARTLAFISCWPRSGGYFLSIGCIGCRGVYTLTEQRERILPLRLAPCLPLHPWEGGVLRNLLPPAGLRLELHVPNAFLARAARFFLCTFDTVREAWTKTALHPCTLSAGRLQT